MPSYPSADKKLERRNKKPAKKEKEHTQIQKVLLVQLNLANALNRTDNIKEGLALCLDAALQASRLDCGGIYLFDDVTGDLNLLVHKGLSREFVDHTSIYTPESENVKLIKEGKPFYSHYQTWVTVLNEIAKGDNICAFAALPIHHNHDVIGCMNVGSHTSDKIPDDSRIPLEMIAMQLGAAISKLKSDSALRESEDRYRTAIEKSTDGIALSEGGRYSFFNSAFLKIFGYESPDEIAGKEITVMVHPEDKERVWHIYNLRLQGKKVPEMYEFKGIRKDGASNHIEITATKITHKGRPLVLAYFRDITEKKKAAEDLKKSEQKFRESESKFKSLFENAPLPFALTSLKNGTFVDTNNAFYESTGYAKEELIGKRTTSLGFYTEKDRLRLVNHLLKSNKIEGLELDYGVKGGKIRNSLTSATIIHHDGEPFILSMFVDVTDYKRLEYQLRQTQKMESIGTLAGGIAHDFNNILGIILGNAEMAKFCMDKKDKVKNNVDQIIDASLRGKQIIRQLLDFSRQAPQTRYALTMSPLIKESIKLLSSLIPANIDIRQNYEDDGCKAMVDPTQIHQIIINLCTNASRAMSQRGGTIDVALDTVVINGKNIGQFENIKPGRYIHLRISDTGEGIAPENLHRIFEPYFTTRESGSGSGLGLSVVHGIVKDCKGAILVSSELNKGTTFTILFPVTDTDIPGDFLSENVVLPLGNERVLFVDNELHLGLIAKDMLNKLGYQTRHLNSSTEALKVFSSDPGQFDLVITDMSMPKMTGTELAGEMLKIKPDIHLILCTGYSENMDEKKAKKLGFKAFLMKPVKMKVIAEVVRKVLDGSSNPATN